MLTNHALPRHPIAAERVRIRLDGAVRPTDVSITRIDADHANAKARWVALGEPAYPSPSQVDDLHDASRTVAERQPWEYADGVLTLEIEVPPHAVASIAIDMPSAPSGAVTHTHDA